MADEASKAYGGGSGAVQKIMRPAGVDANEYPIQDPPVQTKLMVCAVISSDKRHKRPIVIWIKETKM
jgi:hypothetical protein